MLAPAHFFPSEIYTTNNEYIYPRFKPTSEWDIAAGHIILIEAGGKLETVNKKEVLYNLKENVINPYFIASCKFEL